MGFYESKILPHLIELLMKSESFSKQRRQITKELKGKVLEVGFGTGLNLPHYPETVSELWLLDPSEKGKELAQKRIAKLNFPVQFVTLNKDRYEVEDRTFDCVFSTWTMCSIKNLHQALLEMKRILKKDGQIIFLEHGLSDEPGVAKWQNYLNPIQKIIGGGCHLNRPICEQIEAAGLTLKTCDTFYMDGPKFATFMYRGIAVKSAE